ncbi:NAD(P)/FAD-dependent oxidoreductase [Niabella drilacis]|uniref:Thioredoxin reductase n=1 Tax=Niabella drilacis (strain DSM 25811 / CCM 8410 / CCUG 62505 / LMG 26954 / E90) TaxID=1285928 RepID=A0A1G6XXT0_NIADE|nr:NAD(P)/FAD-dependent oxidoreductase [Niabella drilacis]SDD82979.1 Thioredoxin reductase [Niabella drilacis]
MEKNRSFDVVIIGGSYAGLSAAMALGRSLKNVLVLDSGTPCNAATPHSHNFLTQDGKPPAEIAAQARQQVAQYTTVQFLADPAAGATASNGQFTVTTLSGDQFNCRKLIFATGIRDLLPAIDGISECWGKSVIHCPYCHGYEFRNHKTGILANGAAALHLAVLVRNLTSDLTVFTNGPLQFTEEEQLRMLQQDITVIQTEIRALQQTGGQLQQIIFTDNTTMPLQALYARVPFEQQTPLPAMLGCAFTEQGHIQVDPLQKTTVPGIYACGDAASPMRSVASAVAGGNLAGAMANHELSQEDFTGKTRAEM